MSQKSSRNLFCDYLFDSQSIFKFLSDVRKLRLISIKNPNSASSHPEKKSQTHGPGWNEHSSIPGEFRGVYRKMVMVNMVFVSLGLPDLDGMVRHQGIAFPGSHRSLRCRVTLTYKRSSSPIRSGGGGPDRMVRIRCESEVRIKIPESGFKNPDPDAFAFSLVWFADPDHVRIRNQLHFVFRWVFLWIWTQGSRFRFASHPTALEII